MLSRPPPPLIPKFSMSHFSYSLLSFITRSYIHIHTCICVAAPLLAIRVIHTTMLYIPSLLALGENKSSVASTHRGRRRGPGAIYLTIITPTSCIFVPVLYVCCRVVEIKRRADLCLTSHPVPPGRSESTRSLSTALCSSTVHVRRLGLPGFSCFVLQIRSTIPSGSSSPPSDSPSAVSVPHSTGANPIEPTSN